MDLTIRACRICLNIDVKMFYIDNVMENEIKTILGSNKTYGMLFPKYICYECVFLLTKFIKFREKYMTAQSVLSNFLQTSNKITEQDIKHINRNILKSDLHHHKLPPISFPEEVYMTLDMTVDEEAPFEVKPVVEIKPDVEEVKADIEELKPDVGEIIDDVITSGDLWVDDDGPLINPLAINENSNLNISQKPESKKYVRKKKPMDSTPKTKSTKITKQQNKDFTNSNGRTIEKPEKKKCVRKKNTKVDTPNAESNLSTKQQSEIESKDYTEIKLSFSEQLAEIEKRKDTCNYKDAPFKCELCYKGFILEETFRNHAIKHDVRLGDNVCPVCQFRFSKRHLLNQHALKHAHRYACAKCNVITLTREQMKVHLKWHDGVLYKCQYCDEVLSKKTSYLSHVRIKHPSQFVCDECGYSYISALGLKLHKSKMHKHLMTQKGKEDAKEVKTEKKEESSVYCEECDVTFLSKEAWKRHTVTSARHREEIGTACRDCGSCFPSGAALRAHSRLHVRALRLARQRVALQRLPRRAGYPRACEHCPEILTSRMRHWRHYLRCHKDKRYPHGERKFICEYCGKKFQSNWQLRGHVGGRCAAHAGPAPLACTHCALACDTRLDLQEHILKVHTDIPSFPCKYCGKVFWRPTNASQHAVRCKAARKKAAT